MDDEVVDGSDGKQKKNEENKANEGKGIIVNAGGPVTESACGRPGDDGQLHDAELRTILHNWGNCMLQPICG